MNLIDESRSFEQAGDVGEALRVANFAARQAEADTDAPMLACALAQLAHLHFRQGNYNQAQTFASQAMAQVSVAERAYADALMTLGLCAAELGDLSTAEAHFNRTVELCRQYSHPQVLRAALHNLAATIYVPQGKFVLALAADEESLKLAEMLGLRHALWFPLATMGWVHIVTGQFDVAVEVTEQLATVVQPNSLGEGFYFCLRGDLAQRSDLPTEAEMFYAQARSVAEVIGDPGLNVLLRLGLSRYYRKHGNPATAIEWADDAFAVAERVKYRHLMGMARVTRGRAHWRTHNLFAAEDDFRRAIEIFLPLNADFDIARAYFLLAALLQRRNPLAAESAWLKASTQIVSHGYAFLLTVEQALAFPLLARYLHNNNPKIIDISSHLLDSLYKTPPPKLHIYIMSHFEVRQNQRIIPARNWIRRSVGKLFRYLLIAPHRTATQEQIIEALWREKTPSSAKSLFHQATSGLRHVLEPGLPTKFPSRYLQVKGGLVILHLPSGSWVDTEAFDAYYAQKQWDAAFALYDGELLPDDRYDDWAVAPREALKQKVIRVAVLMASQLLSAGQINRAIDACRAALSLEPWQEEAVLLGMKAYIAQNNRIGAIRLYLTLQKRLQEDLGIKPEDSLQKLYQSLL